MNLLVNLNPLNPPLTGIGHYTHNLLKEMMDNSDVDQIIGIYNSRYLADGEVRALLTQSSQHLSDAVHVTGRTPWIKEMAKNVPGAARMKHYVDNLIFSRRLKTLHNTVYWEPNFIPYTLPFPTVPTIHDLGFVRYPEHLPAARLDKLTKMVPTVLANADHIVTVSEFSKQEIIEVYGIHPELISVVSPAVSSMFSAASDEACEALKSRYALPKNFVLALGTIEPRKNIGNLLKAYELLPLSLRQDVPLVLVGAWGWQTHHFADLLDKLEKERSVIRLGYLPQEDLPILISAAVMMAFVSLYEGFGMPILEAMACGTPVITGDCASMPEVSGDAAILTTVQNPEKIAQDIQTLLDDSLLRARLRESGLRRVADFSWKKSADTLVSVFRELQEGNK